jgi:hypothetical protein
VRTSNEASSLITPQLFSYEPRLPGFGSVASNMDLKLTGEYDELRHDWLSH